MASRPDLGMKAAWVLCLIAGLVAESSAQPHPCDVNQVAHRGLFHGVPYVFWYTDEAKACFTSVTLDPKARD